MEPESQDMFQDEEFERDDGEQNETPVNPIEDPLTDPTEKRLAFRLLVKKLVVDKFKTPLYFPTDFFLETTL